MIYESVSTLLNDIFRNVSAATKENVNDLVASFNYLLLNGAKKCNMLNVKQYSKINTTKTSKYKEWFNGDCHDKRNAFNRARRLYKDHKSEENLKLLKLTGKEYKTTINKCKAVHRKSVVADLKLKESNDPKAFWEIINKNTKQVNTGNVTIDEFLEHFSELNAAAEDEVESECNMNGTQMSSNETNEYSESDTLNVPISGVEVTTAVKRLKNGKPCGEDNIINEKIRAFSENHLDMLAQIFNVVLLSGHIPNDWLIGIIKPIYKNKGDINNPDSYRGITLLSCLGKLFTSIINKRLTAFINSKQIMSEAQAGFRKGYSTTDQIFTLKCIVELFLCQGRRLFCTFVDYSKAFDSINRAMLWKKLISYDVSGKVFNVILNMYKSIKSCVMNNSVQSELFESHVGLRQGEHLSPLLFALFLNDLETFFPVQKWNTLKCIDKLYNDSNGGISGMLNMFVLLYADDTVIMAENESDMQRNLDLLNEYCISNKLKVNISKTKMLVFARSKTRIRNIRTFKFGDMNLDQVEDYIYLGICFNWNGSFVKAKKVLYDKASKAMYSLIQKGRRLNLPTDVMLILFDKCVEPILLYGCEVWGCENVDILEKVHTKFSKFIFGVSKFSHNMPVNGELGRYPLSVTIKQRMVSYWTTLLKSSKGKLNKVMYLILYHLYCKDIHYSPWIKCISNIFQTNGTNYVWLMQDHKIDAKSIQKCECDQFKQLWHSRIINNNNVMYQLFKTSHCKEMYTEILPEHLKKALFQFRIGTYKLPANNLKNNNIPRNERICTICDEGVLGDEIHFLYECTKLDDQINKYIPSCNRASANIHNFTRMLQTTEPDQVNDLAKFILYGLKLYCQ